VLFHQLLQLATQPLNRQLRQLHLFHLIRKLLPQLLNRQPQQLHQFHPFLKLLWWLSRQLLQLHQQLKLPGLLINFSLRHQEWMLMQTSNSSPVK
jgi:hypothetical protein